MSIKPLPNDGQCVDIYFPNITTKSSHISCRENDYLKSVIFIDSKLLNNINSRQDISIIWSVSRCQRAI